MPKTREQYKEIKDERRECIIRSCTSLFSYHDYQSVSVDTITKASNCSHGLFYHYFSSKEHVFDATLQSAISEIEELLYKKDIQGTSPTNRLTSICDGIISILSSQDDYRVSKLYLLLNLHLKCDSFIQYENKYMNGIKPLFPLILEIIDEGQKLNEFDGDEPKKYTVALVSMIKGLAYNRIHIGYKKFTCPNSRILMNIVLKR